MNTEGVEESSSSVTQIFNSGNKIFVVKLNDDNYLLSKFQVLTTLEGYELEDFLDEDAEPPAKTIAKTIEATETVPATTVQVPNLEYKRWKCQDRLISSWLLGSSDVSLHFIQRDWVTLQNIYSARSLAQDMQYKNKLKNIKKGAMPQKEYFMKIQRYIDALALVGKSISRDDHILYILAGLGPEDDSLISVISV